MLRTLLEEGRFCVAPGVFDGLSARIADAQGFDALYLTGYGVSASLLARPDAGFLTAQHMTDRIWRINQVTNTPLIADADTGFGGVAQVEECVLGYERAGAEAIQIEDQEFPKRCGHTKDKRVIELEEAAKKIKVACDARSSNDFLVVARTDALTPLGLEDAVRRGDAYLEAGADILFIEAPATPEQFASIADRFKGTWLLANIVEGGKSPTLSAGELESMGYAIGIFPVYGLAVAAQSLAEAMGALKRTGDVGATAAPRVSFEELNRIVGFEDVWALDDRVK